MTNKLRMIAFLYLLGLSLVAWGYGIGRYDLFPAEYIRNVEGFIVGGEADHDTSLVEKLANDANIAPTRFFRTYPERALENTLATPISDALSRREDPLVYIDDHHREGYRAVFGVTDLPGGFWGGVLIDGNGKIIHTWKLSTEHLTSYPDRNKNLYGLNLYSDGSVIFSQQEDGGGLVKVDACSNVVWSRKGMFHHAVSPSDDSTFWSFAGSQTDLYHTLVELSASDGEIVRAIDMHEVRLRNPFIHIFDLQAVSPGVHGNVSHGNDIEPLSREMAAHFEQFEPGDLLISYRTQNLVFVLDPDTLEIKWWRIGAWDRQHDPDWEPDGTIAVFANNDRTLRHYSDIVSIDPTTYEQHVIVNGEMFDLYSSINGEHSRTAFGTRMITSGTQGWVFEVDDENHIVFSYVNNYERKSRIGLHVSEAQRVGTDFFGENFWERCSAGAARHE